MLVLVRRAIGGLGRPVALGLEEGQLLREPPDLDRYKQHWIDIVIDRLVIRPDVARRLADSLETALKKGETRPDCYSEKFSPQRVMEQFDRVFLA